MSKTSTTLHVDKKLFKKYKQKCQKDGMVMSSLYERWMKEYLEMDDDVDTVSTSTSVDLNKENKSWIRRKLRI